MVLMDSGPSTGAEFKASLTATLRREVDRSVDHRWVEPPAISVDELALALSCASMNDACLKRAGENLKADAVMLVAVGKGRRSEVVLSLVSVHPARPTRMAAVPLVESPATLADVRQAARSLLGKVKPTRLTVVTDPPGAQVQVDGKMVGSTPVVLPDLPDGRHTVGVSLGGYGSQASDVDLHAGDAKEVRITLVKQPVAVAVVPKATPPPQPVPQPEAAATPAPVLAAAAPAPPAPSEAPERQTQAQPEATGGSRPTRWLAVVPGVAGVALGLGALVMGGVMLGGAPLSYVGIWQANQASGATSISGTGVGLTQQTAQVTYVGLLAGGGVVLGAGLLLVAVGMVAAGASAVLAATVL